LQAALRGDPCIGPPGDFTWLPCQRHDAFRALARAATDGFLVLFRLDAPFRACTYAVIVASAPPVSLT
jgi:hypothetical protein